MKNIFKLILCLFFVCSLCSCEIKESAAVADISDNSVEISDNVTTPEPISSEITNINFEGTWNRTNVQSGLSSSLYIENQTKEGFDFSITAMYFFHMGNFTAKAEFVDENKAVCHEIIDEYGSGIKTEIIFSLEDETLIIVDNSDYLPMGARVTIDGEYIKGEPDYINKEDYALILPNKEIENTVKAMLDEQAYYYFEFAARDGYVNLMEFENVVLYEMYLPTTGMRFFISTTEEGKIYIWLLVSGSSTLYTNDENYLHNEMRMITEKELGLEDVEVIFTHIPIDGLDH